MVTNVSRTVSRYLLEEGAAYFNFEQPYRWTSGWFAPVYMDNRLLLSVVEARTYIVEQLVNCIKTNFGQVQAIAGVATAGIPNATLVADRLSLPLAYVRSEAKKHGLGRQVEGRLYPNTKVVVIEDLVSTGESSLRAVEALRVIGLEVLGLLATFSYGFSYANQLFIKHGVPFLYLANLESLIEEGQALKLISPQRLASLEAWRNEPDRWGQPNQ